MPTTEQRQGSTSSSPVSAFRHVTSGVPGRGHTRISASPCSLATSPNKVRGWCTNRRVHLQFPTDWLEIALHCPGRVKIRFQQVLPEQGRTPLRTTLGLLPQPMEGSPLIAMCLEGCLWRKDTHHHLHTRPWEDGIRLWEDGTCRPTIIPGVGRT